MVDITYLHDGLHMIKRQYCVCGNTLEYWLDEKDEAFAVCSKCDVKTPDIMIVKDRTCSH